MPTMRSSPEKWSTLGRVLLFFIVCAILLIAAGPLTSKFPRNLAQPAIGALTSLATFALTFLFVRWDRISLKEVGAAPNRHSITRLFAGIVIGLLLVTLQTSLVMLSGHVHWVRNQQAGFAPAGIALLAYLTLACREELAFRGYPLRRLEHRFGAWTAQLFVALIFALEHRAGGYSWSNAFLGVFVGSLLFGMAALATRGLAVPIGIHAAWNYGQWLLSEKEMPGLWQPVVDAGFQSYIDHAGTVSYLIVFGLAILVFWYAKRRTIRATSSL